MPTSSFGSTTATTTTSRTTTPTSSAAMCVFVQSDSSSCAVADSHPRTQDESFRFRPPSIASTTTSRRSSVRPHLPPPSSACSSSNSLSMQRRGVRVEDWTDRRTGNFVRDVRRLFLSLRFPVFKADSLAPAGQDHGLPCGRLGRRRLRRLRDRDRDAPGRRRCSSASTSRSSPLAHPEAVTDEQNLAADQDPVPQAVLGVRAPACRPPAGRPVVPRSRPSSSAQVVVRCVLLLQLLHRLLTQALVARSKVPAVVPRQAAAAPRVLALDGAPPPSCRRVAGRAAVGPRVDCSSAVYEKACCRNRAEAVQVSPFPRSRRREAERVRTRTSRSSPSSTPLTRPRRLLATARHTLSTRTRALHTSPSPSDAENHPVRRLAVRRTSPSPPPLRQPVQPGMSTARAAREKMAALREARASGKRNWEVRLSPPSPPLSPASTRPDG